MNAPTRTAPCERPILFSGPMVRAILAGTKAQTRRVVKPQPTPLDYPGLDGATVVQARGRTWWWNSQRDHPDHFTNACPYGAPGDTLWVRETWGKADDEFACPHIKYAADGTSFMVGGDAIASALIRTGIQPKPGEPDRWRPSIHMPRWASRLTLDITGVRVERLHDISEADIAAEGITRELAAEMAGTSWSNLPTLHDAWGEVWTAINGRESWNANPWVWVVEFARVKPESSR